MGDRINPGARYYGALTLPVYDLFVLKTVVPFAWQCPLEKEYALYDACVGARHLDVGVASGHFLDRADWPVERPAITLMDLNPNSTRYAAHRLRRFRIEEVVGDALDPFPVTGKFDSVALFHLLHCIPGSLPEKAVALGNAAAVLADGGVVFGANVTPADCEPNLFARGVLRFSHALGALNNRRDSHADMRAILDETFRDVRLERVGCMSLWQGRDPR